MNYTKAVGAGLLVFAIQFALVNVVGNIVGPFLPNAGVWAGYAWQAVMIMFLIAIVYHVSKWYFTGNNVSIVNGVLLGLILVVTNVVVTLAQAIPALLLGQDIKDAVVSYLTSVPFWLTVGITVAAAAATAYWRHRVSSCNVKEAISACMPQDEDCIDCKDGNCQSH